MHDHKITTDFTIFENIDELSSTQKKLLLKAIEIRDHAYAPYSRFSVGAAVLMENGEIFTGNNQENAAYPSGICAERVAIWTAMASLPQGRIKKIFISARSDKTVVDQPVAPCGACRQAIAEYETRQKENIEIFFTGEKGKIVKSNSIKDLLPWMFDNSMLS
ncbi:cytidine deaminase [Lutimonas zeaxanthinifaciens]|uniref:cytidine deaminase n=1 Tax=Lutimonas zeaxanthinifaciens TaxID=3060215 RepID=UPI00265D1FD7|nr:cytidine deaminase [Lutimonas sp. YSD2104]WKK66864.1 cytidine deaminase [Lutimonas sp. YSD2104]